MRLGELLRQKGLITAEQLKASLDEQARFGGRVGTNLIQLGLVEMDAVALALSEQQNLPPVLREHVASIERKTLALFPARMVLSHKAIPIGYTLTKPERVVVACMDPAKVPLDELAFAAGRRVEMWIAPEALIQECLEKYFGVTPAPNRYVSLKLKAGAAVARAAPAQRSVAVREAKLEPPRTSSPAKAPPPTANVAPKASRRPSSRGLSPPPPPPVVARTLEMPDLATAPPPISPPPEIPVMTTPAWSLEMPVRETIPEPIAPEGAAVTRLDLPAEDDWDVPDEPVRAALEAPPEAGPVTAPPEALRPVIDRAEASQMLEMATSKDQIGRVLADWLRSTFGCGLVLMVKGDMAIGWKGFFADAEELIEAVAIPLGKPSMFASAYESHAPFRGPPPGDGAKVQDLLWKLLRCAPPGDAVVSPVVLGKRVVNLLYAHMDDGSQVPEGVAAEAAALAREAAAAYARLIGKERGKR